MQPNKLVKIFIIIIASLLLLTFTGCFYGTSSTSTSVSTTALKPQPKVESVVATTSGTEESYYTTLDIKVTNDGAEGTILVEASVTQNDETHTNKMPVFLKKGETHELKMTFPLEWEGGEFTSNVKTTVP